MKGNTYIHNLVLISALIVITACGGGGSGSDAPNNNQNSPPTVLPPQPAGMLLSGLPTDDARSATVSLAPSPAAESDIDGHLLKTRLAAVIAPGATVAQVNTVLTANNAAIVSMLANDPYVTLVIASVADRDEAQAKAEALVATGAFIYARPGYTYEYDTSNSPLLTPLQAINPLSNVHALLLPEVEAIDWIPHLVPGRIPATWHLQTQATASVNLLVPDWYKEGSTYTEIPQLVFSPYGGAAIAPANTAAYATSNRGFHHLGVAAANWEFDSGISPHTGSDPVAEQLLNVMAMHTYGLDAVEILNALVLNIQVQQLSNIVPNTVVLSSDNFNDPDGTYISYLDRAWLALKWRRLMHTTQMTPFVHIVAAGDSGDVAASSPALNTAELNSVFGIASGPSLVGVATLDGIDQLAAFQAAYDAEVAATPAIAQPLNNVLLVGSSQANGTVSTFSTSGAQVRTVGESVTGPCLLISPYCSGVTEQRHQTSAAAAQIAGIAAYLWHLDSSLSVNSLLLRLQHAYSASGTAGILDGWIAALSIDRDINNANLRMTLLDVSGPAGTPDGFFTEHDIDAFLNAFAAFTGAIAPDWSVYDLNGDGWTAGVNGARMDLDVNVLPGFSTVTQMVGTINKNFDETNVTDQQVLCYYAWSTLYTGNPSRRAAIPGCGGLAVEVLVMDGTMEINTDEGDRQLFTSPSPIAAQVDVQLESLGVWEPTDGSVLEQAVGSMVWNLGYDNTTLAVSRLDFLFDGTADVSIVPAIPNPNLSARAAMEVNVELRFQVNEAVTINLAGAGGGELFRTRLYLQNWSTGVYLYQVDETLIDVPLNYSAQLQPGIYSLRINRSNAEAYINTRIDPLVLNGSATGHLDLTVTFE